MNVFASAFLLAPFAEGPGTSDCTARAKQFSSLYIEVLFLHRSHTRVAACAVHPYSAIAVPRSSIAAMVRQPLFVLPDRLTDWKAKRKAEQHGTATGDDQADADDQVIAGAEDVIVPSKRAKRADQPEGGSIDIRRQSAATSPPADSTTRDADAARNQRSRKQKAASRLGVSSSDTASGMLTQANAQKVKLSSRTARKGAPSGKPVAALNNGVAQSKAGGQRKAKPPHTPEASDSEADLSHKRRHEGVQSGDGLAVASESNTFATVDRLRMDGHTKEVLIPSKINNSHRTADADAHRGDLSKEQLNSGIQKINNKQVRSASRAKQAAETAAPLRRAQKVSPVTATPEDMITEIELAWGADLDDVLNEKYWPRECDDDVLISPIAYATLPLLPQSALDSKLLACLVRWATLTGKKYKSVAISKLDAAVEKCMAKNKSSPMFCTPRYEANDVEMMLKDFREETSKDERAWAMGEGGISSRHVGEGFPGDTSKNGTRKKLTKKQIRERQ